MSACSSESATILVVDNEASVRALACEVLRREGYTCLNAGHELHAIQLCKHYPGAIHLLLAADAMPWMNGPELAARVLELRPYVRVLYMAGASAAGLAQRGEGGGAWIQKPFTEEQLLKRVRQVLGAEPGR